MDWKCKWLTTSGCGSFDSNENFPCWSTWECLDAKLGTFFKLPEKFRLILFLNKLCLDDITSAIEMTVKAQKKNVSTDNHEDICTKN